MTVTPLSAPYTLELSYSSGTLSHSIRFYTDGGYNSSEVAYWMKEKQTGTWVDPAVAALAMANLLKAFLKSTDTISTWTLYQNDSGAMIPRNQGSLGVAGTSASTATVAMGLLFFFRDTSYLPFKSYILGAAGVSIGRWAYAGLPTEWKALVDALLNTATGNIGAWATSRGFNSLASFLAVTGDSNDKSRRRLGIA